jgi:signal transduction histidine kinase
MESDVRRLLKVSRRFELIGRRPALEPVSVGTIVDQLRRYFSARLPSLGSQVRFSIEIPEDAPAVQGNETLLEWAFENLIKNSLDALAGHDGMIGVVYVGRVADRAVFRVFDDGPGVAHRIRGKLFEIGVTTKERGWGVGLSLTRRIIEEMHGGGIVLETSPDGASFRIELPVADAA